MSDLADRMRAAADTLEEANKRYNVNNPNYAWRPDALRREARHIEDEDQEADEREAMAKELAWELYKNSGFEGGSPHLTHLEHARKLIESGWCKVAGGADV